MPCQYSQPLPLLISRCQQNDHNFLTLSMFASIEKALRLGAADLSGLQERSRLQEIITDIGLI